MRMGIPRPATDCRLSPRLSARVRRSTGGVPQARRHDRGGRHAADARRRSTTCRRSCGLRKRPRITSRFSRQRPDRYGKTNVRRDVEAGSLITAMQYLRAQKVRAKFVKEFTDALQHLRCVPDAGFSGSGRRAVRGATAVPPRVQRLRLSGLVAAGRLLDDAAAGCRWRCRLPLGRGPRRRSTRPRPRSSRPPVGICSARVSRDGRCCRDSSLTRHAPREPPLRAERLLIC